MKNLLIAFLLFLGMLRVAGQTGENESERDIPKAEFNGKGVVLDNLFQNGNNEQNLFLYNSERDMFLNAGGYWGTQLMTYTVGLPLTITKTVSSDSDTYYMLSGPFNNDLQQAGTGNYIGIVVDDSDDTKDGVFWDRGDNQYSHWFFEKVQGRGTENEYRIKSSDGYYLVAGGKLLPTVLDHTNMNAVYYAKADDLENDQDKANNAIWKIVDIEEIINDFANTENKENPANATFLIRAQNFNRMNIYRYTSKNKEGIGWLIDGFDFNDTNEATDKLDKTYTCSVGLGNGETINGSTRNDATHGMFYNAEIKGSASAGAKVYQIITAPKKGWYRLDCEGMFYNYKNEDDCNVVMYATVNGATEENTSQNSYINLLPIKQKETQTGEIDDRREAGMAFYYGYYPNSLIVYVPEDNKDIEIGIRVIKEMTENDFAWFDDFELRYLGNEILLDETETFDKEDTNDYKNRVLILKRTLTKDKWNTLILPVNLTKQQMFTAFFPNPMIAQLSGFPDNHTIGFNVMDLNNYDENDIVLEAGKCYIIKPGFEGKSGEYKVLSGTGNSKTITGPYYLIDRVSLKKSDITEVNRITSETSFSGNSTDGIFNDQCSISFYGCYQKTTVGANAYVFSKGNMYHLTSDYTTKGFSCWIEDKHQMNNGSRHAISFSLNGVDDGTTAIEGIRINGDGQDNNTADKVFSISGQVVRSGASSIDGLPKGIYIVNGKKYVVK